MSSHKFEDRGGGEPIAHSSDRSNKKLSEILLGERRGLDEYSDLEKPWRYKDWLIWPRTVFSKIEIADCNDTPEGICYRDLTLQECIDKHCPWDICGAGMYVKFKSGKSICSPLRTGLHPKLTPLYRLRKQAIYDLDPNVVDISVFVNSKLFPFPPNLPNVIFYGDILAMKTADGNRALDTSVVIQKGPGPCTLKKDANSTMMLLPSFRTANPIVHDRPLVYGDKFIMAIVGTSYIAQVHSGGINPLLWKEALGVFEGDSLTFDLIPSDPKKKKGDLVTYADTVVLGYQSLGLVAVDNGSDILYLNTNPELMNHAAYIRDLKDEGGRHVAQEEASFNVYFKFESAMYAFYCDEGNCKRVALNKVTPVPSPRMRTFGYVDDAAADEDTLSSALYKGKPVFNHARCWGMCDAVKPGKGSKGSMLLPGDQHIPMLSTKPTPPLWESGGTGRTIIWVVIGIVITILMVTLGVLMYRKYQKA